MELCGKWWRSEVAFQVHTTLTEREKAKKRIFQGRSPQLAYRRQLVDWITSIAERHKLGLTSLHLAVYLLDFFMDNFDVSRNQLNLVAMGCLSVATKFEEKEEDIPKQNVLSQYCAGAYAASDFLQMELMLLKFFEWEVGLVTPAHIINFYIYVTCTELDNNNPIDNNAANPEINADNIKLVERKRICDSIKSYARYFMSVCIQYHHFHDYLPSVIAAASICATRFCLNLIPVYPPQLQKINAFTESQLLGCQRDLLLIHDRDKNRSPTEAEIKKLKPETSTPEGTPEGVHVATNPNRDQQDDSNYHSDLSLDSDPDSLPMDIVTAIKEPRGSLLSRVRSPSCSPIPRASSQDDRPQHQLQLQPPSPPQRDFLRRNGVSVGSSEEEGEEDACGGGGGDERMVEEVSSDDRGRFSCSEPSDGSVAETIEIDTNNEMSPEMIYSTHMGGEEVSVAANEAAVTSTRPLMDDDDDDDVTCRRSDDVDFRPIAHGGSASSTSRAHHPDVTGRSGLDDVAQDFDEVVDLVDDDDDSGDDVFEDDSVDNDVVVISEGRRVTNDSGLGIVAEDLGAEEECYDDEDDGEVFIEELQPAAHPNNVVHSEHNDDNDDDDLIFVEKPSVNAQIFSREEPMTSREDSLDDDEAEKAQNNNNSFVSSNGSFRVSIPFA